MTVGAHEFHRRASDWFDSNVQQIADHQWDGSTPCTEWDVRALVHHLVYEQLWIPPLLEGQTIEQVGQRFEGDILGDDPKGAWRDATEDAFAAVGEDGAMERTVALSRGGTPANEYIGEMMVDHLIHSWDLGFCSQINGGDFESAVCGLQFHCRRGADAFRWMTCLFEIERKRHGKTTSLGRADQFLGVRSLSFFKAR